MVYAEKSSSLLPFSLIASRENNEQFHLITMSADGIVLLSMAGKENASTRFCTEFSRKARHRLIHVEADGVRPHTFDLFGQFESLEGLTIRVHRAHVLESFLPEQLSRLGFVAGFARGGAVRRALSAGVRHARFHLVTFRRIVGDGLFEYGQRAPERTAHRGVALRS